MAISVEQRFALLSALGANIDWNALTIEQVQAGITGDLKRVGREATLFIQSGCQVQIGEYFRETGEISIQLPALKRPTFKDIQKKYDYIKSMSVIPPRKNRSPWSLRPCLCRAMAILSTARNTRSDRAQTQCSSRPPTPRLAH